MKTETQPGLRSWLIEMRKKTKLTQAMLAEGSGLSATHISKVESELATASREAIRRIAKAFAGPNSDNYYVAYITDLGLVAAGFTPENDTLSIVPNPDHIAEDYKSLVARLRALPTRDRKRIFRLLINEVNFAEQTRELYGELPEANQMREVYGELPEVDHFIQRIEERRPIKEREFRVVNEEVYWLYDD